MSQVRTYRPDEPVDDELRNNSVARASHYASSTHNAYHTPADASSLGQHEVPTAPVSELAEEDAAPPEHFADSSPGRPGTLKKKTSVRRGVSRASSMRRSVRMPSAKRNVNLSPEFYNVFNIPIPTTGNPTEALANRFQAWRKLLKDLTVYFREIQASYDVRSKATMRMSTTVNATLGPPELLKSGGINEALSVLRNFHRIALGEANRAKEIEEDVINQLNLLRNDLNQKIKEIKGLSGDFKNSVEKERDNTRRMVESLKGAITTAEQDPSTASGKGDPFILRLGVDRQVEKQIDEENYLHRAYLNLENSGRELESIIVGEIQKAYNAYATILNKEVTTAHNVVDQLRTGPIAMPKDHEWSTFVENNPSFVNPGIPVRSAQNVYYPGQDNPIACEIRGGPLERKSKYLKSYTPGWYVLSPTHLHEFKSAEHLHSQQPVMSLYLLDQKLGSHSQTGASSHKFSLKGRQTGSLHRGHSWVFRAESYDTMLQWYADIKALTEKTGDDKKAFVRQHARTVSGASKAFSTVSDGLQDDEADRVPFAAKMPTTNEATLQPPKRPEPGGRFPSDLSINRNSAVPAAAVGLHPDDDYLPGNAANQESTSQDVSHRGPNATSNFQQPPEFPERYKDTASVYTGKKSRPTSSYYPESAMDMPINQQRYQEEPMPLPYAANDARPRSTPAHHPPQQEMTEVIPVPRHQEERIAQTEYGRNAPGSRAASAQRSQALDPRHELAEYPNHAELPTEVNTRGAPGYSNYDPVRDDTDVLAGAVGGAALGAAGGEGYSRFNRHQEEPAAPYPSQADYDEPVYGHVAQQPQLVQHEQSIAPGHEHHAIMTDQMGRDAPNEPEQTQPEDSIPVIHSEQSMVPPPEQISAPSAEIMHARGPSSGKFVEHFDEEPMNTNHQDTTDYQPLPSTSRVEQEAPAYIEPLPQPTALPQYQYGDFKILGAGAYEELYKEKQHSPPVHETETSMSAPITTTTATQPEVFQGDQLPDGTEELASSNMLSVPLEPYLAADESPSSEYGDRPGGYVGSQGAQHDAEPGGLTSTQDYARREPELSTSTLSGPSTDSGAATPRPHSAAGVPYGKDAYPGLAQIPLTSPYPILAGPAPYKNNPEYATNGSSFPAGTSPTDKLLEEAAQTTQPGSYTANVEVSQGPMASLVRQDTSMTVSNLPIPGRFPNGSDA